MKNIILFFALLGAATQFFSCNTDEGLGGTSSVEGYVYNIVHQDDNFGFQVDTFIAAGKKVYINFGNSAQVGKNTDVGFDGYYRFDYLTKGNYKLYALSESVFGEKTAEIQNVKLGKGTTVAPNIYVHSGKAYGTAIVRGRVWVKYYNKGIQVKINNSYDAVPAVDVRVYIKYLGEKTAFDDVRTSDNGYFLFKKLQPNLRYEVYVNTEQIGEQYKHILSPVTDTVAVGQPERVYPLDTEKKLELEIKLNN